MCNCSPEDVHNYGPCGETCSSLVRVDWSYPEEETCRICSDPIISGEICAKCAEDNDPFFTCDNVGRDLK